MGKDDVIQNRKYITYRNEVEEDRATAIGSRHRKVGKVRRCGSIDMRSETQTNRQTDRQTDRSRYSAPYRGRIITAIGNLRHVLCCLARHAGGRLYEIGVTGVKLLKLLS